MPGTLSSGNSTFHNVAPNGNSAFHNVAPNGIQPVGNLSNGRFAIDNLPTSLSQMQLSHMGSYDRSGFSNIGGSEMYPNLGTMSPHNTNSMSNSIRGGLSTSGFVPRLNSMDNGGYGDISLHGSDRFMSGLLSQAPQVMSMPGNSYFSMEGPLSQNPVQIGNKHSSSQELVASENAPPDIKDFPQLSGHPKSASGGVGQPASMWKQSVGAIQKNQELSIQNDDFPALPTLRGRNDYPQDWHPKEQFHDNNLSMMQSQNFLMGRSAGNSRPEPYPSQQQQQYLHPHDSNMFPSSIARHITKPQSIGPSADRFGLLGLLSSVKMGDANFASLALGFDPTTLVLNLNTLDDLHKVFASPWSEVPAKAEPEYSIPECYYSTQPPKLTQNLFSKLMLETLFYIFYSMPKEEAQLYAANELTCRGWIHHKGLRVWLIRDTNIKPIIKTETFEGGTYHCFNPNSWTTVRKDNFILEYELIEKRPALPRC